ncbi:VirD4-like conjugal transfer protein, CD1115 family [Gordonibacter pamelaeae]|uniref:VirD4-like conjugal transfer protein, CD1115 family n=1 Tax=Gordonibacter pamelaeae TaxID=471189 RepID=UPI003AF0520F
MDAALVAAIVATPAATATANLYAANLASIPGTPIENLAEAAATLPSYFLAGGGFSADPIALCAAALGACAVWVAYANHLMGSAGTRKGEEHGSSRWATKAEMRAFADAKDSDDNIILTQNCALALVPRRFDQKTDRNKNVMVVGGSGSGKTRYFVKPNLLQMNCSYFVTDPKATLAAELREALESAGYRVVEFSTIDMNGSAHYNPIAYVKNEADVLTFVECLIRNTSGDGEHSGDPFWEEAERLLYVALVSYLVFHCPEADRNVPGLLTLLGLAEAREEDEDFKSPLDIVFEELERGACFTQVGARNAFDAESRGFDDAAGAWRWIGVANPVSAQEDFALSNYKAFKTAAGKTLKSIIISCNVRLKPLSVKEVSALLSRDEMSLGSMGDAGQKTCVFASMSDTNPTFNFLFTLLMWQTVDVLCNTALERHGGSLPTHVHFVFDEFANIGELPNFEQTISTVRSRNISCSVIVQSFAQLEKRYREGAEIIKDNCDTTLFLGGKAVKTNKEISEAIGKETVSAMTVNDSRGQGSSTTRNRQIIERDLMQASEVGRLPRDEAIVLIAGANPIRDKKYRLEGHPRYGMLAKGR